MADEQTPQSELIDDAIKQAERQLEDKLQALRMSALGETTPPVDALPEDVAILRPTGGAVRAYQPDGDATPASIATDRESSDTQDSSPSTQSWQEEAGLDVTFVPAGGDAPTSVTSDHLYVPEEPTNQVHDVTDLVAVWDEDETSDEPAAAPADPYETPAAPHVTSRAEHRSWANESDEPVAAPAPQPALPTSVTSIPSEDELEFWAHTRTALRNLQQVTETVTGQVTRSVTSQVERIVHEGIAPTQTSMHVVEQQLQQGLPKLTQQLEHAIDQALSEPSAAIRQVRDDLPAQLERSARATQDAVRAGMRDDLDASAASIHGAVQKDVAQLEQSIATNVTRMAQGTTEGVARVERDLDALGEAVARFERGVQGEFDRVDSQLRASIEQVGTALREDLVEPSETVRKLDDELPARFGRVERTLTEQIQGSQRDLTAILSNLVDANRATLDRIASIASTMDEDRSRSAQDVETIIDTVATGWEGLAGAVKVLFEQNEAHAERMSAIEQRLSQIRDLEGAVEETMTQLRTHINDLQPAPVIVTVAHPEAEVRNSARSGWLPKSSGE